MRADFTRAEKAAEELLTDNLIESIPIPVEEIAQNLGLTVRLGQFPDASIAGFVDLSKKLIMVNYADSPNRRAFTLAHEVAHFQLHRELLTKDPNRGIMHRRPIGGETDPFEQEANCFAGVLLVPERFLAKYYSYDLDDGAVAKMFGVSEDVIRYRLQRTGRR